jgi:DNA-binding CsgD family transcriptional regulator/tetratricopeptide (TPR) repeat protein
MQPILERGDLLDRLSGHLGDAAQGSGSLIFLTGEAGAGKSTVVREFARTRPTGTLILTGYCDPLSTPRPLGPLLYIAAEPDSGLGEIAGIEDGFEVFGLLLGRLQHSIRPILMVIEDVHWADAATLDMITYLGRRIGNSKALMIATYRDDEVTNEHPLQSILGDLVPKPSVYRYPVDLLSRRGVHTLAEGLDVDADRVFDLTGGNAFYVTELLATDGNVPDSVQDAVLARVGKLDPDSRAAVEAVSVAPRSMTPDQIMTLTGVPRSAADQAVAAGVLVSDKDGYRFRHELARLAIETSITEPFRIELNRSMVEILGESADLSSLAHHAVNTRDPAVILEVVPLAARQAARRQAHRQAVGFFGAAHPFIDRLPRSDQTDFLAEYFVSLSVIDRQNETLQVARDMAQIADTMDDPYQIGRSLRFLSRAHWMSGDVPQSNQEIARSVAVLEPLGDSVELAHSLFIAANNQMLDRHFEKGVILAERSLEMAGRIGDIDREVAALQALGTLHLVNGDVDRGIGLIEKSIALGGKTSNPRIELVGYSMLGTGGGEVKIYDRALDWLGQSIAMARERDEDYSAAYDTAWQARIKCEQGRWDEAIALAGPVAQVDPGRAPISAVTALGTIGRVMVRRGDPGAEAVLRDGLALGATGALQHIWVSVCSLAEWHWLRGDNQSALDVLEEFHRKIIKTDTAWGRGEVSYWMWRVGGLSKPPPNMAEPFALMIGGQWSEAALKWERIGCPYEQALALAQGDTKARLAGLEIFDDLGARPAGQWLRKALRDQGVPAIPSGPRSSTKKDPMGLTRRQSEVLALVEQGLGNAEIARRLFISQKTAEHHVSAILTKLGASSRAEAIALSHRTSGPGDN